LLHQLCIPMSTCLPFQLRLGSSYVSHQSLRMQSVV